MITFEHYKKHQIELKAPFESWMKKISDAVFCQILCEFKEGELVRSRLNKSPWSQYEMPYVQVYAIGRGEFSRFSLTGPPTKYVKALDEDKNGNIICKKIKGKYITVYENGDSEIFAPMRDYYYTSGDFEENAHKAIEKYKDKPNFWAVMPIRMACPHLDYIEAGLAIGHD
jgi:hypothetical protein